jgi:N,N'-diacetyllegionaminate synthase
MFKLDTNSPFLIAEVGQAHDGSLGMAHSYIDAVATTGAHAIKFQTHFANEESSQFDRFRVDVFPQDANRFNYWKRMEFTEEQWMGLAKHCKQAGLVFLSSPFSIKAVEVLQKCDIQAWKLASGEWNNLPMIEKIIETRKPILVSTGMANWVEIDNMLSELGSASEVVFQCTTEYPSRPETIGLNNIETLRRKYPTKKIGLSDHSGTIYPTLAAYCFGARVFEVHVCFSKQQFGPDTAASLSLEELGTLNRGLEFLETAFNNNIDKNLERNSKKDLHELFGRGIFAKCDIKAGDTIKFHMLSFLKPQLGISARDYKDLIGCKSKRYIAAGEAIFMKDLL